MQHLLILLAALVFAGVTPFLSAPEAPDMEWIAEADEDAAPAADAASAEAQADADSSLSA